MLKNGLDANAALKAAGVDTSEIQAALADPEGYATTKLKAEIEKQKAKIDAMTGDMKLACTDPKAFIEKKVCDICKDAIGEWTQCASQQFITQVGSVCTGICTPVTVGFAPATIACIAACTAKAFSLCKDKIGPLLKSAGIDKTTICTKAGLC